MFLLPVNESLSAANNGRMRGKREQINSFLAAAYSGLNVNILTPKQTLKTGRWLKPEGPFIPQKDSFMERNNS